MDGVKVALGSRWMTGRLRNNAQNIGRCRALMHMYRRLNIMQPPF